MAYFELDDVFGYQDANDIKKLWASDTAPSDPAAGEIWLDTSVAPLKLKRYNGSGWDTIGELTANDILNLLKSVDGSGSGLDADQLDSQHGDFYLDASNMSSGILNKDRLPDEVVRTDQESDISANTNWSDTFRASFGNDSDLKIYHDGTHSFIDNTNGNLYIRQLNHGANLFLQAENESGILKTLLALDPDKNIVEGRISRSSFVELWTDNETNESDSPYIQTGTAIAAYRESYTTITFDTAFTSAPRVFAQQNSTLVTEVLCISCHNITTTSFRARTNGNEIDESSPITWLALGKKL